MGVVRRVEYKDVVEDERVAPSREVEEILAELKSPELIQQSYLPRVRRWKRGSLCPYLESVEVPMPSSPWKLEMIRFDRDVVVIGGLAA